MLPSGQEGRPENQKLAAMQELEHTTPVKSGTWQYAGSLPCAVRIVRHHTLYGSGDHEDPPEAAHDLDVECFYVLFQTLSGQPEWVGGGVALTLTEAVSIVEAKLGTGVVWHDETVDLSRK